MPEILPGDLRLRIGQLGADLGLLRDFSEGDGPPLRLIERLHPRGD